MGNEERNVQPAGPVRRSGCLFISIVIIILAIIAGSVGYLAKDTISSYFDKNKVTEESTIVHPDTVYESVTIDDILISRETVRENKRVDDVFMNLPSPILVAVLSKIGTDATIAEIVYEYEYNKDYYANVKIGADIQKQLTQQDEERQKNPEDSIEKPKL